ncbi:MAG: leucine-rich repeat domain-containing protein [Planctomycetales bacterium]|nr:leucine-rich repeat domain-containing protein [Planctomycetales bacterium]
MKSPATHRYFRFGLRTFLTVITVAAVSLGCLMYHVHQQKATVRWVQENMGGVEYAIAIKPSRLAWLRSLVGVDRVAEVSSVGLDGTHVSDVSPLANLKSLESLFLNGTQVSDISALANLDSLKTLQLRDTQVSDLTPLAKLKSLKRLTLSGTQVSDVTPLAKLKSLEILVLVNTPVSDLSPLANVKSLEVLALSIEQTEELSCSIKELKVAIPNVTVTH